MKDNLNNTNTHEEKLHFSDVSIKKLIALPDVQNAIRKYVTGHEKKVRC